MWLLVALVAGCTAPDPASGADSGAAGGSDVVPWSEGLVPAEQAFAPVRGYKPRRGIIHLHSPWSHDACDGDGIIDGQPNADCLADLRIGLCTTSMDFAYLSDHPSYSADQAYDDLFMAQAGDDLVDATGQASDQPEAMRIHCSDVGAGEPDHTVLWMPGVEDTLMPVGLSRQAGEDAEGNYAVYTSDSQDSVTAEKQAGAIVLMAHTESKDLPHLQELAGEGLQGTELFNLHAMFDPNIRQDYLGLDPLSWLTEVAPFTDPNGTAEPDLLVLAILQEEAPSIERWDALLQDQAMVGTAGTDAHENVMPQTLRDGERGDSYRRLMRWFSNILLTKGTTPADYDEALSAGRLYVAFEVLGTPAGFDFYLQDDAGTTYEMGSTAPSGTLHVGCPTLSPDSPRDGDPPDISVTVFKDGQPWADKCGDMPVDGPGVYRVRVDMIPRHLAGFLGDDPDPWMHAYPWIYSNAIRVEPSR